MGGAWFVGNVSLINYGIKLTNRISLSETSFLEHGLFTISRTKKKSL